MSLPSKSDSRSSHRLLDAALSLDLPFSVVVSFSERFFVGELCICQDLSSFFNQNSEANCLYS